MIHQQVLEQIYHLPIAERIEIIEKVSRSVREDIQENQKEVSIEERRNAIDRLRGIASVKGKTPPTDAEIKEDYINYLSEKYK
jgi:hypothetical protein